MTEEKKMVVQGITFEPVLTTKQVCEIFKINKSTLVRWRKQGKFPQPIAINSRLKRYRKAEFREIIRESFNKKRTLVRLQPNEGHLSAK